MIISSPQQNFTIFSDSKSSLQAIKNIYSNHPVIRQIQSLLIQIKARNKRVSLCWVPAHVSIPGNEKADDIAKTAALSARPPILYKNFYRDYYPLIKKDTSDKWKDEWNSVERLNNRPNKLRSLRSSTRAWSSSSIPENRHLERSICRLRIGHCHFSHKYLMERGEPPECEACMCPLTVDHVLRECVEHQLSRATAFGPRSPTLRTILSEEDQNFNLERTSRFLYATGILGTI